MVIDSFSGQGCLAFGYLIRSIPGAELILQPDVNYFAPLRRSEPFNRVLLTFLNKIPF